MLEMRFQDLLFTFWIWKKVTLISGFTESFFRILYQKMFFLWMKNQKLNSDLKNSDFFSQNVIIVHIVECYNSDNQIFFKLI